MSPHTAFPKPCGAIRKELNCPLLRVELLDGLEPPTR